MTPAVFLAVLEGNKAANVGKGTGRVLESTADDNVMIFFSDHGAPNLIAFPTSYLYADALLATFAKMQGQYQKVVFYLEVVIHSNLVLRIWVNVRPSPNRYQNIRCLCSQPYRVFLGNLLLSRRCDPGKAYWELLRRSLCLQVCVRQ